MSPYDALPARPGADDFCALAQSSPWRFATLQLTHRRIGEEPVEAWLARPWRLRVRTPDGREQEVTGPPYTVGYLTPGPAPKWRPVAPQDPGAPRPRLRPDGLVAERPEGVDYDDPMWQDFRWVAMLDPVELGHHVDVGPVSVEGLRGRPTWWAECRAMPGYQPRCSCCALLVGEVSRRIEAEEGAHLEQYEAASLPSTYLVGLDVETGIVASLTPLDGDLSLGFENVIHATG